jgi:hypothetical protein
LLIFRLSARLDDDRSGSVGHCELAEKLHRNPR